MRKQLALIAIILLLPRAGLFADTGGAVGVEHRDFLSLYYFHRPELKLRYELHQETEEDSGAGAFDLQLFGAELELPFSSGDDTFYSLGGVYNQRRYEFSDVPGASTQESDNVFHEAAITGGLGIFFNNNFLLLGKASIGSYSDFEEPLDMDALRVFGEVMGVFRLNPGAQLLFGARHSEDFEDVSVLPLLGIRLQDTEGRLHVSLTVPVELKIGYHLDRNSELYGRAWIEGDKYRVEMGPENINFDARVHERKIAVGYRRWLGGHVALNLELGGNIGSELEFQTPAPGQFVSDGELENSVFGSLGLDFSL